MEILTALFIISGAHITENLEHHKKGDVERILEDKGFKQTDVVGDVHFYAQEGGEAGGRRTLVFFGTGGFVLAGAEGVKLFEGAE